MADMSNTHGVVVEARSARDPDLCLSAGIGKLTLKSNVYFKASLKRQGDWFLLVIRPIAHWCAMLKNLTFVRRTGILLQCDMVSYRSPPLGVSSLDLGRLIIECGLFFMPRRWLP
jgi:hypothetical protein